MSIPKEPRQLMINLMYLVLTALLALNVSAEVMNAFFSLDDSIDASSAIVSSSSDSVIEGMKETIKKKTQYKPLEDAAIEAKRIVADYNKYIKDLRAKVETAAGGVYPEDHPKYAGRPKAFRDKEIPTRLFVDGQEVLGKKQEPLGPELKAKTIETRQKLLKLVDDVAKLDIKGVSFEQKTLDALKDELALNIDETAASNAKKSWERYTFGHMPVAAVYPILTKFESDATASEATIINFLAKNIGATIIEFDKFVPVASSEKSYILKGEKYEADIFLSAFSSQASEGITMSVNGSPLPIEDGIGHFSSTGSSIGEKSYNVKISVKNPFTGETEDYQKEFKYEVGERSITVSADQMNVFYIGVPNPITVAAAGISTAKLKVNANGAGGSIKKKDSQHYTVTVKKPGECRIVVSGEGKPVTSKFRVKRIPDPVASLNPNKKVSGGAIGSGEFKAYRGIFSILENFDFDAKCLVKSFDLVYVPKRQDAVPSKNAGASYNQKSKRLIKKAKPGDIYYFDNVKTKCPGDVSTRKINTMVFKIR